MSTKNSRLIRDSQTVAKMVAIYCHDKHKTTKLCPECCELLEYAQLRLGSCRFKENKPTCAKCAVHCYRPDMREKIRVVMRFSGPRMVYRHPILALRHVFQELRKTPVS